MAPGSKRRMFFCIPLSSGKRKARNRDVPLAQSVKGTPTPTPAAGALEHELAEEKAKVTRLEQENERIKAEADETKRKLEDELREVREDLADKNANVQRLEKVVSEMQTKKSAELQSAVARNKELSTRLAEKDELLTKKTTELSAAQAFLTKVDAVSEADVVGMVKNLNTLISSTSGTLQDAWDERDPVPGTLAEEPDLKNGRDDFSNLTLAQIASRDPVAVNLGVQMTLGYFIKRITSGWGQGEVAETLAEIYGMISTKESQTIASRWRTLTKRYIPHQELLQGEDVMGDLARILVATRSFSEFSEAKESVEDSAGTEIKAIVEATLQLDDTIKTKIASSDMSVYIVLPGATFNQETMTNEFGEGGEGGEGQIVAGTMEIGLLQRSENAEKVLWKPKVILERDLVEPEGGER